MITVTKAVKFDAAHVLTDDAGKCRNLHGHTYRVEASVESADAGGDMVCDFRELKRILAEEICERFDHTFIYNRQGAAECEIAAVVERQGMRTAALDFRSTAENLSRHFFGLLKGRVPGLKAVRVWETADNSAEFRA